MNRKDYDVYLSCFNNRNYDGVTSYFNTDAAISFADVNLKGHDGIRNFYNFFHDYVSETIRVDRYLADDQSVMMEAVVKLEGKKDLTPEILQAQGFPSLAPLSAGQVIELPQFIHYHLENGKFRSAQCTIAIF